MKKKPILIAAVLLLAAVWVTLFLIDYNAVMNLHDPVIAWHVGVEGGTYQGPGWQIEIVKRHVTENGVDMGFVTQSAEISLFGIRVGAAIT
ncbi:MAG: hypothetical protein IJX93_02610 [Clostridia bacterium]|nr:hypothetical protein [Clostridia bacterium]MBQ8368813.1 hypothetical protein [Clostridia bacterium]MBQ8511704.1 hypothetical protein [Clostridia bacterium]